jgi:hypothetical protein
MTYLKEYEITLTSGVWYLLAPNSEDAAWAALELSRDRGDELLNVKQSDEW